MNKYQSYKPSGVEWVGKIPQKWNTIRLKHEYKIQKGKIPKVIYEEFKVGLVPYLSMEVIRSSESNSFVDKEDGVYVNSGQILVLWDGSNSGEIFKVNKEGILSSTMGVLNKIGNQLNEDYSFYLLKSNELDIRNNTNGMGIPHVDGSYVRNLPIFVPPLHEQQQIVQFLDEKTELIDKLISTKERKIKLLKEQRTSLINQIVTKGLNPKEKMKDSGVEWIGGIPENWNMFRVSNFGTFFKGSGIKKDEVKSEGLPCIRYGEIYTKYERVVYFPSSYIDEETSKNSVPIVKGDILFTGSGETIEDIGKSILYYGEENIFVGSDIIVLRLKKGLNPLYLSYLLNSFFIQYQKSLMGRGEIIVHIYSKNIKDIRTPLPPLSEQNQIVDYLDLRTKKIDDLVQLEQKKIDLLKEYRQSLISEVVTGKIKVTTDE